MPDVRQPTAQASRFRAMRQMSVRRSCISSIESPVMCLSSSVRNKRSTRPAASPSLAPQKERSQQQSQSDCYRQTDSLVPRIARSASSGWDQSGRSLTMRQSTRAAQRDDRQQRPQRQPGAPGMRAR